ncbi:MAG: DUF3826 domain-containing protein [Prevotella sp.]|nr:DUF3826 domain-containing protein [Prevotella sp.]
MGVKKGVKWLLPFYLFTFLPSTTLAQTVKLNSDGRDTTYVNNIVKRSQKIVDGLGITADSTALNVRNIIANRYFLLNDIHEECAQSKRYAKDSLDSWLRNAAIEQAEQRRDALLYKHHFELEAALSLYITPEQIEGVKDGMTFGVVPKTYQAHLEMIPSLTDFEKQQILAWLKEAREFAMDAENSNKKHNWFGKYKGRINNWLSARGYDLVREREGWYQRIGMQQPAK